MISVIYTNTRFLHDIILTNNKISQEEFKMNENQEVMEMEQNEDCKKDNDPDDKGVPEVSFPS